MRLSDFRALTFDCYGTLIDWEGGAASFLYELARRFEREPPPGRELRTRWEELQFERAAYLRDQIRDIEMSRERQHVLRTVGTDQDVIAFARENGSAVVQVFYIRAGVLSSGNLTVD